MAKAAEELPDIWTQHLSKIKVKMDKAELVRTLAETLVELGGDIKLVRDVAIAIECGPDIVGATTTPINSAMLEAVGLQLDDLKKEYLYYKSDYGL